MLTNMFTIGIQKSWSQHSSTDKNEWQRDIIVLLQDINSTSSQSSKTRANKVKSSSNGLTVRAEKSNPKLYKHLKDLLVEVDVFALFVSFNQLSDNICNGHHHQFSWTLVT